MADEPKIVDGSRSLLPLSTFDGWFNPGQPVPAMAPDGTQPRQFDYSLAQNQIWTPRGREPIGFRHLQMMADGCYLVRAIIEKMKDRVCSRAWHFRLKAEPGEVQSATVARSGKDPRIPQITNFFLFPDSINSFPKWMRMLLEDRLVIDAATLEVQRNRGGQIINLLPVDGATINVLIDSTGRRPKPPLPAYRQVVHGLPATDFTPSELIYMPANVRNHKLYGYGPVEQTLALILTVIYKTVFDQNWYSESDIPLAYMPMPENMSTAEITRFMREFHSYMNDEQNKNRQHVYPTPFGSKIELLKKETYQNEFEQWAARVFSFVLGETATPFIKQNNRATANQADDTREESGEGPLIAWFKGEIDAIVQRADLFNAPDIEFVWDDDEETDRLKQAQIDQIYVTIHKTTPNELRTRDGQPPIEGGDEFPAAPQPNPAEDEEEDQEDGEQGAPKPPKGKASKRALKKNSRY
jgi:hypothetical protein